MWLFTNDFKHRHIIYRWKAFFATSINSRSLPQNKAMFDSDPLTKFVFSTRESVSMIWALSSQIEGTIVTRRSRGTCWNLEPAVGVDGNGSATLGSRGLATHTLPPPESASTELGIDQTTPSELPSPTGVRGWLRSQLARFYVEERERRA